MSGFRPLFFLTFFLLSCAKFAKADKEGEALYVLYKTAYSQPRTIGLWLSPQEFLPEALPSDKLFISNLNPDELIVQVNRDVYINKLIYEDGGKALGLYFSARSPGIGTLVSGHLIFIRRNDAERILVAINGEPYLYTNLRP